MENRMYHSEAVVNLTNSLVAKEITPKVFRTTLTMIIADYRAVYGLPAFTERRAEELNKSLEMIARGVSLGFVTPVAARVGIKELQMLFRCRHSFPAALWPYGIVYKAFDRAKWQKAKALD